MGKEVIFAEEALATLSDILDTLCTKRYFGALGPSEAYVERLKRYAMQNIGKPPIREAPPYFSRYGKNLKFVCYRVSRTTSWYIFYQEESDRFLVRHIANNYEAAR